MTFRKTEAITISQKDYSETSQVLTLYTRDYGKITVLARGIKRPKHRLLNPPDLFSHSEIIFINKSPQGTNLLTEITVKDNFPLLRANLERLRRAFYIARFLNELTEPEEPSQPLFNLALRTIRQLASVESITGKTKKPRLTGRQFGQARKIITNSCSNIEKMIIFSFETQALKYLGYMPNTLSCPTCLPAPFRRDGAGRFVKRAITKSRPPGLRLASKGGKVTFSFYNGSILCPDCRVRQSRLANGQAREDDLIEVSAGVMKLVDVLSNPFLPDLERLKITRPMQAELRGFINKYIIYIANT